MTEGRTPPQNHDAERALLGSCLVDAARLADVLDVTRKDHFLHGAHRDVWQAILDVYGVTGGADTVAVAHQLVANGTIESVGGLPFLSELLDSVPHGADARYYANILREMAMRRGLINTLTRGVDQAYSPVVSLDELTNTLMQGCSAVMEAQRAVNRKTFRKSLEDYLEPLLDGHLPTVSLGMPRTDEVLNGGLRAGHLVLLAARPSVGKTALALRWVIDVATRVDTNEVACLISLEQSMDEIRDRMLSIDSGVPLDNVVNRVCDTDDDSEALRGSQRRLVDATKGRLVIDDHSNLDMVEIGAIAERAMDGRQGLVVIDYLQLIRPADKLSQRVNQIEQISRDCKLLADKLGVPIVLLAQLSREVDKRSKAGSPARPMFSDLKNGGSLEQDGDVIFFLMPGKAQNEKTLILAKNRGGAVGDVPLAWAGSTVTFLEEPEGGFWSDDDHGEE